MPLRKINYPWLQICGLLMGILLLLGGCVAPDGSVIRLQQGADGSIVGWQLDAPQGSVATNPVVSTRAAQATPPAQATPYPPRPILYYGYAGNGEPEGIRSVQRDGGALDTIWSGYLFGWSPNGDRFAYMDYDSS